MTARASTITGVYTVAAIAALMSDIVVGYLFPTFKERRWLAVGVFFIISLVGIGVILYQQRTLDFFKVGITSRLDPSTIQRLLKLLLPLMDLVSQRKMWLQLAFTNVPESPYHDINLEGAAKPFTLHLLRVLARYGNIEGRPALCQFLETIKGDLGEEKITEIADLCEIITAQSQLPPIWHLSSFYRSWSNTLPIALVIPFVLSVWLIDPLISDLWAQNAPSCPPDRVCILVANIAPENNAIAQEITRDIAQELNTALGQAATSRLTIRVTSVVTDAETARERAQQDKATLIVWGEVLENVKVLRVHFELISLLGISDSQIVRTYRAEPLLYDPINQNIVCRNCTYLDVSDQVAQQVTIMAYTAVGLVDYIRDQPEQARFAFFTALFCAGEQIDPAIVAVLQSSCTPTKKLPNWNPELLYYYLGKSLVMQGDYQHGIDYLERASSLNSLDPAAPLSIGSAYQSWLAQKTAPIAIEKLTEAEKRALALISRLPPDKQGVIYHDLGLIQELKEDLKGAQKYYSEAVKRFGPNQIDAYTSLVSLGRVQREGDQSQAAKQTLEKARRLEPNSPWAYLELAQLNQEKRLTAEQTIKQAESKTPDEAYVYITRARLCQHWKDYDCVVDSYARAVEKRSNSGWLYSSVGVFYTPTNPGLPHQSWTIAEDYFRQAVDLRPSDPWVHEHLAYVLLSQQSYLDAIDHYQKTIDFAYQKNAPAGIFCNLGVAQQNADMKTEAKKSYERCAELAVDDKQRSHADELLNHLQ